MFTSITVFKLKSQHFLYELEDALSGNQFEPCGPSQEQSVGFVPPRGNEHGEYVENVNGQWIAKLMIETKSVPGAVLKRKVDEKCVQIETTTGRKPGKKERREIAEEVKLELLPHAFPKQSTVTIWFDPINKWLVLDTVSSGKIDIVTTALVRAIDKLSLQLVNTGDSPTVVMREWLSGVDCAENFSIDRECELRASDETQAVVKYNKHSLDVPEVRDHIKQGKYATRLALTWKDRVSFVVTDSLHLRKVVFLDVVLEDKQGLQDEDVFDADIAIATGELTPMLHDLFEAFGGESDSDGGAAEPEGDDDEL